MDGHREYYAKKISQTDKDKHHLNSYVESKNQNKQTKQTHRHRGEKNQSPDVRSRGTRLKR